MKKFCLYFFLFGSALVGIFFVRDYFVSLGNNYLLFEPPIRFIKQTKVNEPIVIDLPDRVNLDVPFTSQAPFEVWDDLHNDACEEAAVLQAASYWLGVKSFTKESAEQEIQNLVQREIELFGYSKDTNTKETAQLIDNYYDFEQVDVYFEITKDQIIKELANGYPVIVPTAGRLLGNPYFRSPGPIYHMLVIRGFDNDQFITNDNGTKRGQEYRYDQNILMEAIHDWNNGDIENGQKAMIVIRN